jgi:hypothetical protein
MLSTIYFRISAFRYIYLNVKIKIQRPVTFPPTLSGFETWPLMLKEGIGLSVFQTRVMKRILGLGRWEVRGEGRNFQLEERHGWHSLPDFTALSN